MKSNEKVWLKRNITINTELRKKAKTYFENFFCKLLNNAAFTKAIEIMRKHRDT